MTQDHIEAEIMLHTMLLNIGETILKLLRSSITLVMSPSLKVKKSSKKQKKRQFTKCPLKKKK
jgi:hypothetical protein